MIYKDIISSKVTEWMKNLWDQNLKGKEGGPFF